MSDDNLIGPGSDNAGGDDGNHDSVTRQEVEDLVNRAVNAHVKRSEKRVVGSLKASFDELKEALLPKSTDSEPASNTNTADDSGKDDKPDPELTSMKRQMTQQSNRLNTEIEARKLAEKRVADDGLKSKVSEALGLHNINGNRQAAAMALLYQSGKVKIAEDGVHLFVDTNGDELPLGEGLKSWAGSDEAKLFTPPREIKGSGDKGQGRVATFKGKDDKLNTLVQVAREAAAFLIENQ